MPELPEVETIRRDLQDVLVGEKIKSVKVRTSKVVPDSSGVKFATRLQGQTIAGIDRRAKLLIVSFTKMPDLFLLLHLKMTGQLIYQSPHVVLAGGHSWPAVDVDELPNKYSHVIFTFASGAQLFFNDLRQFGYLRLVKAAAKDAAVAAYGIEPLTPEFSLRNFRNVMSRRKAPLKVVLLDQTVIAGLGNIYVDEACHAARIMPSRRTNALSAAEVARLHAKIKQVITKAIQERGTTFNQYRDGQGRIGNFVSFLKVYGRAGQKCSTCRRATITKMKVAGRGTAYCPQCQS